MNRDYAIDAIRLISILGVVVIHTTTAFVDRSAPFSPDFFSYHFINQIFRFAVPLFFLISGYLLAAKYTKIENPLTFYKRRLGKILLPYIIWSIIYYLFIFTGEESIFSTKFLNNLFTGDSSYQLYFIPAIIVLYLTFPFIIYFKKILVSKWFIFFLILLALIPTYYYYIDVKAPLYTPLRVAMFNLLPFVAGIYAAIRIKDLAGFIKSNLFVFSAGLFLCAFTIFSESTFMYIRTLSDDYLRSQWRIGVFLYGIFAGAILYYLYPKYFKAYEKTISYLASFALGVFFVHVAILDFMLDAVDSYSFQNPAVFVIVLGGVIIFSFIFSIVGSKIKVLSQLLGLRG